MKNIKTSFVLLITLCMLSSCQDFFEPDLGKKELVVNSPADKTVSPLFSQTFWWDELKGADEYQIQIVKPSFSSMQRFIMDTTVSGTKVELSLSPGTYEWRIRAKNSTSSTAFITRILTIDSTLDLSSQPLALTAPYDNFYSNRLSINFSWQTMPNTQNYVFQLLQNSSPIYSYTGTSTSCTYTVSSQGIYQWRVFAQNSSSNSSYTTRTFTVDTAKPLTPVITLPSTDTLSSEPAFLQWSNSETGLSYRLLIALDSNFTSIIKDTVPADNSFSFYHMTQGQDYYWKVRATDKALNESYYSSRRHLKKN